MERIQGADTIDLGGQRRGFRGKNPDTGQLGTVVTAEWLNGVQEELSSTIESLDGPLDAGRRDQLLTAVLRAVQRQEPCFTIAGGTANDITASLTPSLPALIDGMTIIISATSDNSGPVTLDVDGLGPLPVTFADGSALEAGEIITGQPLKLVYFKGSFLLLNTTVATRERRGNVRYGTTAEVRNGLLDDVVTSPSAIATAVQTGEWNYAVAGGSANAIAANLTPAPATMPSALIVRTGAANTTSNVTLNVNGLGALPVVYRDGTPVLKGECEAGTEAMFVRHDVGGNPAAWIYANPILYFTSKTPAAARTATAFNPGYVLTDLGTMNVEYVVQTLVVSGASYMQINASCAIRLNLAISSTSIVGCTIRLKVTRINNGANVPVPGAPYIGAILTPSAQIPLATFATMQNLDPAASYKIELIAAKSAAVGPVPVADTLISVLYG